MPNDDDNDPVKKHGNIFVETLDLNNMSIEKTSRVVSHFSDLMEIITEYISKGVTREDRIERQMATSILTSGAVAIMVMDRIQDEENKTIH